MNILLLSSGGGGGNILRSLKAMFRRDLQVASEADPEYAARLERAVTTRFLDTNEFSLADIPEDERVLIGATTTRRLGSRHNPDVAGQALEESTREVEALFREYAAAIIIGTGGKGTGAGTMFPLAQMARRQRKLVIPIFVRPSFERHEVDKRRYDHALRVVDQFDAAKIRLIEILNDRGYVGSDPQPQSVVWERMNLPIARGLRSLLYVLSDLSQVDPSDLAMLFAGEGRLRLGFSEIEAAPGRDPDERHVDAAAEACWQNPYCAFTRPVGTSLICIQGDWSNLVDARIKGRLAAGALDARADNPYNPLYARTFHTPKPWGVTALFAEHTGAHAPLEIDWSSLGGRSLANTGAPVAAAPSVTAFSAPAPSDEIEQPAAVQLESDDSVGAGPEAEEAPTPLPTPTFSGLWEFAVALNRGARDALTLAAQGTGDEMALDGHELRKLVSTFWFRSAFARLSDRWRTRLLDMLVEGVTLSNHQLKFGRHRVALADLSYEQLLELATKTLMRGPEAADVQFLLAVGRLWGKDALGRFTFLEAPQPQQTSRLATILQGLTR